MRKSVFTTVLAAVFAVLAMTPVFAGNLDAPAAPGATSSHTLDAIWNRLNDGNAGGARHFHRAGSNSSRSNRSYDK